MHKKLTLITLILLGIVIIFWLAVKKARVIDLPPAIAIDTTGQPAIGSGAVTMVAFEDMKCSNCKRYNDEIYTQIKTRYIDTQRVRYVVIPLAFLPGSLSAGNAALCVFHLHQNAELFFNFMDYIYQHQPDEALDWATPTILIQFARAVPGIDIASFTNCVNQMPYAMALQHNLQLAAKIMGNAVQTPMLYINGHRITTLTMEYIDKVMAHL